MLLNYALEYAMRRVQANQDGFKINGTYLLPVYADDLNILGELGTSPSGRNIG
jgi:hypothetical protein